MRKIFLVLILAAVVIAAGVAYLFLTQGEKSSPPPVENGGKPPKSPEEKPPGKEGKFQISYEGEVYYVEELYMKNPLTGDKQRVKIYYKSEKLPAIILVPGRGGSLEKFERENLALYAASKGFIVLAFDPLGRGKSGGKPNDYGKLDQAFLYEVYKLAKSKSNGVVGILSFSFGVNMVAGALADYDMPIEFWIDWEGPVDRIFSQVYCGELTREELRSATDEMLDEARRRIMEKLAKGEKGSGDSCYNDDYWKEREAIRLVEKINKNEMKFYVRLQGLKDHIQPNYDHSIMMVNKMVDLGFKVRLNYGPCGLKYDRTLIKTFLIPIRDEPEALRKAVLIACELVHPRSKPYPIYVTIVMHNEEPPTYPDFTKNQTYYLWSRNQLLKFAELVHKYGAAFDWQSDWTFLKAVSIFDKGTVVQNTKGKNIVAYLYEDLGVSVDPHAHETVYNYADVAELIRMLGVSPSRVVGGFLYYPPDNPQGWEKFREPLKGSVYPSAVWKAEVLWGASTYHHQGLDLHASGVWKPKDRYHFITHDPGQPLIYVGGYRRSAMILGGLPELVMYAEEGVLEADKIYTVTVFVSQSMLTDDFIQAFEDYVLKPLKLYEEQGVVEWATLEEVAEIWKTKFGEQPNIFIALDEREKIRELFPP